MKQKTSKTLQTAFFFSIMLLTFYTVFSKNDLSNIIASMQQLNPFHLLCAAACAVFFVCMEGFMIWYLLRTCTQMHPEQPHSAQSIPSQTPANQPHSGQTHSAPTQPIQHFGRNTPSLLRCFSYSFIGFFFSGITPSATGGQPAQLVAMKKDNIPLGSSTLTLMTVAVFYKLILVIIGLIILLFWKEGLASYLGSYMALYYLGIFLNSALVLLLLLFMLHGNWMGRLLFRIEEFCIRIHLCKPSEKRKETFRHLLSDYRETLQFLLKNKPAILFTAACTFLQRCSLFLLTALIYHGFHITGHSLLRIMVLQASVYIAIDMLPLPGSQGISELLYASVFTPVFTNTFLIPSMCITRGLSFYFPLLLGGLICLYYFHSTTSATVTSNSKT